MSRSIFTFNRYHLGDNLIFLHLLRALAKQHDQTPFVHFCNGCDIHQLREVVADLPNIVLADFESPLRQERQHEAIDTWKNYDHFWENSRFRWSWSEFMLSHHDWTAARMGFVSPFKVREHLLFNYPALECTPPPAYEFDFLIGDSAPSSGQYAEWADHAKQPLIPIFQSLKNYNWTSRKNCEGNPVHSISMWGKISMHCRHHIMVCNGPFWATLNVHNHHHHEGRKRIALLDGPEQLNMPHIIQMSSVDEVMQFAKTEGWL